MLEAVELTRLIVNKTVVPERRGRGRKGYGRRPAKAPRLRSIEGNSQRQVTRDTQEKNRGIAIALGLDSMPDRTTMPLVSSM